MLKKVVITMVVVTFCLSAGFALAAPNAGLERELPRGKWWQHDMIAEKLSLTPDEIEKLDSAYIQMRRKLIRLKSDVEMEQFELENILENQNMNHDAVMKQFDALDKARSSLSKEVFMFIVDVREILGLDRYQQLKNDFRKFRRHKIRERMDRHPTKGNKQ